MRSTKPVRLINKYAQWKQVTDRLDIALERTATTSLGQPVNLVANVVDVTFPEINKRTLSSSRMQIRNTSTQQLEL